jgi:hypothetical protein
MKLRQILPLYTWYIALIGLAVIGSYVAFHRVDPDLWWRIRHGHDLLTNGFSTVDTYSYTMPSFQFVSHAWSFDIVMRWLDNHGSYLAMIVLTTLVTTILFGSVTWKNRTTWLGSVHLLFLWATTITTFGVRAQVFAWPFLVVTLCLALVPQPLWVKLRWYIPLLALLWANFHGSFPLFFLLLGIRSVVAWVQAKKIDFTDLILLLVSIPLTLVNPYGIGLWREVWLTNTDATLRSTITEWQPIWKSSIDRLFLFSLLTSASLGLSFMRKQWIAFSLVLVTAVLGVSSTRHIPLFIFTASIVTIRCIAEYNLGKTWEMMQSDVVLRRLLKGAGFALVLFLVWQISLPVFGEDERYPTDAVHFIRLQYPTAQVFNHYDWGGFLIYTRPEAKVFVDGRMPSWRWTAPAGELDWAHQDWDKIQHGNREVFDKDVAEFGIDTVLWKTTWNNPSPLLNLLKDENWQVVYSDDLAVVYRKPGATPPPQALTLAPAFPTLSDTPQ